MIIEGITLKLGKHKRRDGLPKYVVELSKLGLFKLWYSNRSRIILELANTKYILVVINHFDASKNTSYWYVSDTELDKRTPYYSRKNTSLHDVFDNSPKEVVEKLAFHLDILPE
jgi:hypothetical protein